jgi:hypothetical protein
MKLWIEKTGINLSFNNEYWMFKSINKLNNYLLNDERNMLMDILIIRKR